MSLYFITGIAGTGKTTVAHELRRRGVEAHDADDYCSYVNRVTGTIDDGNLGIPYGTPEYYNTFDWRLDPKELLPMGARADKTDVYVCGSPGNSRDLVPLFDKVYCLYVNDSTLTSRLKGRADNDYGKAPHELADILGWNKTFAKELESLGAIVVDGTPPVTEIVDTILAD